MMEQSFSSSDALWHQFSMTNEQPDPYSQPEYPQPPPFKRPRNFEDNQSNAIPYPPMNSRVQQPIPPVNRTGNIFFKTRMCIKFRQGMCPNGENCNFAHGVEDMRQPPPNWQELVGVREDVRGNANWDDEQRIIQMRKICKKFYNGEECPYGARCNFLHEKREDLGRVRESSVISIGTAGPPFPNAGASDQPDGNRAANYGLDPCRMNGKPIYWKTRLCVKWETTGLCPFGEKCHFAHGQAELQLPGGRTEVDLVNTGSIPGNPIPLVSNDVPLSTRLTEVTSNQEEPEKKSLLKWKGPKKINRIYADWIDDLPLLAQSLPAKVES